METPRVLTASVRLALLTAVLLFMSGQGGTALQAAIDLCGCAGDPTLKPFVAGNPSTYPPGTQVSGQSITLPLPDDGVLKFSSFAVEGPFFITFARNPANTAVTILVSGDVSLRGPGCCYQMIVSGSTGQGGDSLRAGVGGQGGNGGFRGGDAAAVNINGATVGGAGFVPGGGQPGNSTANATGGVFFGVPELLPLVGGSGGGGGASFGTSLEANCTGGGGGGGGGGLLIVANGTISMQNFWIFADGGGCSGVGNGGCARGGAGGSGRAIRLVASRFQNFGSGELYARGGGGSHLAPGGGAGRIRLESIDTSAQTQFHTDPAAIRITGPGPIVNPIAPTVRITAVSGNATPAIPQGWSGTVDVTLPAPGVTSVDVATAGVPSGTTVEVKVKPRIGSTMPVSAVVPLSGCDSQGNCTATTSFNLAAGAYAVEARATFQVQ